MWTSLVELVRATIFAGTHLVGGSLGASIVLVSAFVRLALLALALRNARHARAQQAKLAALQPQIERLQRRYKSDPARLIKETRALYRAHNVRMLSRFTVASIAIQLPLLGALFSAVRDGLGARIRFLWIGDLSRPDAILLAVVSAIAGLSAIAPSAPGADVSPRIAATMAAIVTLVVFWSASSAVALSVGAGSAVSILQNWLLRRDAKRLAALG